MNDPVRVPMRVPGTAPMADLMKLLQTIEAAGFDGAGILDSQLLCRDTFVTLGQAATHTSRMTLFPAVTNPFTRHASVLASAIQTVEELAPGRVKFVIGTGYTSASTIGRKPATLAEMRSCIATVKALLAGRASTSTARPAGLPMRRDDRSPCSWPPPARKPSSSPARSPTASCSWSASTRASWRLPSAIWNAGRVAPGAASRTWKSSGRYGRGRRRRRRMRGASPARPPCTGESCAGAATGSARRIGLPKFDIPDAVWKVYPDLSHAHDWEEAIAATSFVPDEVVAQLCDALGLVGTAEDCARRIAEMTKLGVRNLYLMPFQTFASPEPESAPSATWSSRACALPTSGKRKASPCAS